MSDPYNPTPWQVPPPDGVQRPLSIRRETVLPPDASNDDAGVLMDVASELIAGQSNQIDRFVNNARQAHSQSGRNYSHATRDLDGVQLRHSINNGFERLDMRVFPTGGSTTSASAAETNLDGYIVWVHGEPQYPNTINGKPYTPSPYTIIMNGYLIEESFTPDLSQGHSGGYLFVFGGTALLGPSLAQSLDDANPLVGDSNFKPPFKLVPSPGWGSNNNDALDGTGLAKQPRELGYWLFDWLSDYNPGQYINTADSVGAPPIWKKWKEAFQSNQYVTQSLGQLTLNQGIYFPSTRKSILAPTGGNGVKVIPANSTAGNMVDVLFGEFYDRGKYRVVKQSWTIPASPGKAIRANDYPNRFLFRQYYDSYSYNGFVANFDISAGYTKDLGNLQDGGPDDLMSSFGDVTSPTLDYSLTATQQAQVAAWKKQCQQVIADYNASHIPPITALYNQIQAQQNDVTQAHKAAFLVRYLQGDATLFSTSFPNDYPVLYTDINNIVHPHADGPPPMLMPFTISVTLYHNMTVSSSPGPDQEFWMNLTLPFNQYPIGNFLSINNPNFFPPYNYVQSVSNNVDSNGDGTITSTIGDKNLQTDYGINPSPPLTDPNALTNLGPGTPAELAAAGTAYIKSVMDPYNALVKQYNDLINQPGPTLPTFPNLGNDLSKFKYEKFTISGNTPEYSQSGT